MCRQFPLRWGYLSFLVLSLLPLVLLWCCGWNRSWGQLCIFTQLRLMVNLLIIRPLLEQLPMRHLDFPSIRQFGDRYLSQHVEWWERKGTYVLESFRSIFDIFMLVSGWISAGVRFWEKGSEKNILQKSPCTGHPFTVLKISTCDATLLSLWWPPLPPSCIFIPSPLFGEQFSSLVITQVQCIHLLGLP